ncbi:MAG: phosphodiester glycosidase family protein [Negativicutes bacterium]|jgi:exopolysaccharide biosynthesis protein
MSDKNIFRYSFVVSLLLTVFFCSETLVGAVSVQNIEINSKANEEIVIYLNNVKNYSIEKNDLDDQLVVKIANNPEYTWTTEVNYQSKLINDAKLTNIAGVGSTLIVQLKKKFIYNAKTMTNPKRVVISLLDPQYSCVEHKLTDGVLFKVVNYVTFSGKVRAYVLDVDPESDYRLRALLDGKVMGRTKLSKFANRVDILAAVNGSYFAPDGEIIGALKIDGEIVSSDKLSRAIAGFLETGELQIDINKYQGKVFLPDETMVTIDYINRIRYKDSLVLYNKAFGERTLTNDFGCEYSIVDNIVVAITQGNSEIPDRGVVLSAIGVAKEKLSGLKLGDIVKISQTLGGKIDNCYDAIGAGPQLIKNGKIAITTKQEKVLSDIAIGRAPRTAIAETIDKHILLVVVDGRQAHSIGMTLSELAEFLLKYSAQKAMNLDGGGSSAILVHGRVLSQPSDGRERSIASAIAVVRK